MRASLRSLAPVWVVWGYKVTLSKGKGICVGVNTWTTLLQLLCNKLCLKVLDHGSRSTWAQVLPDPDYRQKIWSAPTKTDLPYNFCFMRFLPSITVETVDFLQTLFRAPNPCLGSRLGAGGLGLTKLTTGKEYYTFCMIKFAWKQLTMAPEAHGAHVLPDPEFRPKNMIRPH
jgi:hypothetical protein